MLALLLPLFLLFVNDASAIYRGSFFNPPPLSEHMIPISDPKQELVFLIGSQINITWQTVYDEYNITLWQQLAQVGAQPAQVNVYEKHSGDTEVGHFLWTIQTYNFDRTASPVYYLDAKSQTPAAGGQREEFLTFFFNLTEDANDPRLPISNAQVQSAAAMFPQAIPTNVNAQGFQSGAAQPSMNAGNSTASGLSPGAKIGLGLGLGLGIPLLVAVGVLIFLLVCKGKQPARELPEYDERAKMAPQYSPQQHQPHQQQPYPPPPMSGADTAQHWQAGYPPPAQPAMQQSEGFPMHDGAFTAYPVVPVEAMGRESRYEVDGAPEMKPGMINSAG